MRIFFIFISIVMVTLSLNADANYKKAYFAGGCFWGVEYHLEKLNGVESVASGYMGGTYKNPTYRDVIYKDTGHYESVEVVYDAKVTSYETLAKLFFEIHDPTQANGQGPDIGKQYLSVIFFNNDDEKKVAKKLITILESKKLSIATKVLPVSKFYTAEEYHQDYYVKHQKQPYCHVYTKRF